MRGLVTISVIRDEADLIEAWARHHAPIAERMIVTLHRSRDGTAEILRRLQGEGLPLDLRESEAEHYPQRELSAAMLREAAAGGAAWVLPLDADEFLAWEGDLGTILRGLPADRVTLLPWRTYVPTPEDDRYELHVLRRITRRREREDPPFFKVLVPGTLAAQAEPELGNHSLSQDGVPVPAEPTDALWLAHVPVRSEAQLRGKVLRGWESHLQTPDRRPGQIFQWETLAERCADPRPIAPMELAAIARSYAAPPGTAAADLVLDPVPGPHRDDGPRLLRWLRRALSRRESILVACATNEQYAPGTAATLRSALDALGDGAKVEITVIDGGLSEPTRRKLADSWPEADVRFVWPGFSAVSGLTLSQGMQPIVYARLLLPKLLPKTRRVLYLDSDLLVRRDLREIWETDLAGRTTAAVPDVLSPTLGCIPGHEAVGLPPEAPYCSTGVLLMDLEAWRRDRIGQRTIDFVREHPECIRWWDQDGLNAVLQGEWTPLDARWNVTVEAARLLGWEPPEEHRVRLESLVAGPHVTHFATRYKPWKHACPHPRASEFLDVLDRTAWRGWRPHPESEIPFPPEPL